MRKGEADRVLGRERAGALFPNDSGGWRRWQLQRPRRPTNEVEKRNNKLGNVCLCLLSAGRTHLCEYCSVMLPHTALIKSLGDDGCVGKHAALVHSVKGCVADMKVVQNMRRKPNQRGKIILNSSSDSFLTHLVCSLPFIFSYKWHSSLHEMNCAKVIYLRAKLNTCGSLNALRGEKKKRRRKKKERKSNQAKDWRRFCLINMWGVCRGRWRQCSDNVTKNT